MRSELIERVLQAHTERSRREAEVSLAATHAAQARALAEQRQARQARRERDGSIDDWALLRRWPRPRDGRSNTIGWATAWGLTYRPGPAGGVPTRQAGRISGFGPDMDTDDGIQVCGPDVAEELLRAVLVGEWCTIDAPPTTGHAIVVWQVDLHDLAANRRERRERYLVPVDADAIGQMANFLQLLGWRPNPHEVDASHNPWCQVRGLVPWICDPTGETVDRSLSW